MDMQLTTVMLPLALFAALSGAWTRAKCTAVLRRMKAETDSEQVVQEAITASFLNGISLCAQLFAAVCMAVLCIVG